MLRDLIDISTLEDFAAGLARTANHPVAIYDADLRLLTAGRVSPHERRVTVAQVDAGSRLFPGELPAHLRFFVYPSTDPPVSLAVIEWQGGTLGVVPVYSGDLRLGYVATTAPDRPASTTAGPVEPGDAEPEIRPAPPIEWQERLALAPSLRTARWASRMLAEWSRGELRANTAAEEQALVADLAKLLSGETNLQRILDSVVADTARVMRCKYASLRLYDPQTGVLTVRAVHNLSLGYVSRPSILRSENPIDDEALRGEVVYVEDAQNDPRIRFPEVAIQLGIRSGLIAGMMYRGQPVGVLRVYSDRKQRFRRAQQNLLRAVASQAATAIVHADLVEERLRTARLEREVELAGQVQSRMVRNRSLNLGPLTAASVFDPSSHVGGDFCDLFVLGDGRLAGVVADVSGKGVPASLLMAAVRGALLSAAETTGNLGQLVTHLNRYLLREMHPSEFVTLLLLAFDPDGRRLTYVNAGHEPTLLWRAGSITRLLDGGLVLGMDETEQYEQHVIPLQANDFLLAVTDGAIEAMNFAGEQYGRERLQASLQAYATLSPDQALRQALWDIRRFVGLADRSDDLTMLGVRVNSK